MEIYGSGIRGGGVLHEGGSLNGWKLHTGLIYVRNSIVGGPNCDIV